MNLPLMIFLAASISAADGPTELKSHVVRASIFKTGLVMLTREVTVPAGNGTYCLDTVPEAIDGTFWYSSPDGLVVTDVQTIFRTTDKKFSAKAQSVFDYLFDNVGQRVKIVYNDAPYGSGPEKLVNLEGIVNGTPFQNNLVPFKLDNGHLRDLQVANIREIDTNGLKSESERTVKVPVLRVDFHAEASKTSKLDFVTIEDGAAWVGSYLVKLQSGGASTVVGKAQIGLGRQAFEDTDVRAMAGVPKLMENSKYDLSAGVGTLTAYLDNTQEQFLQYHPGARDPYSMLPIYANALAQADPNTNNLTYYNGAPYGGYGGFGGGGRGGGGFGGPGGGAVNFADQIQGNTAARDSFRKALAVQATMDRLESLFAYPIGKVSLQPGDRLSRVLFSQTSTYENLFRWAAEVGNENSVVNNILRVHNSGSVPWTGGSVLVTKEDAPLAQLFMPFTPAGKDADLTMADAQDILTKKDETEISRDTIPYPNRPKFFLQRSLNEVHLSVESARQEPVKFELTLLVPGEVVDAGGGKVEKLVRKLDPWNGQAVVTWSFTLPPGDKRQFKIQYHHIG